LGLDLLADIESKDGLENVLKIISIIYIYCVISPDFITTHLKQEKTFYISSMLFIEDFTDFHT